MTKEAFRNLPKDTKLLVGPAFTDGQNSFIRKWLGKIITFDHSSHDQKWIYFQEVKGQPFRFDEIERIAEEAFIDDKEYEIGDVCSLFGEALS